MIRRWDEEQAGIGTGHREADRAVGEVAALGGRIAGTGGAAAAAGAAGSTGGPPLVAAAAGCGSCNPPGSN